MDSVHDGNTSQPSKARSSGALLLVPLARVVDLWLVLGLRIGELLIDCRIGPGETKN